MDAAATPSAAPRTTRQAMTPVASVAAWLGILFALLLLLVTVGGYVRLSGSGLSIPDWPLIHIGDRWTLLPPMTESGWLAARETFDRDQAELRRLQQSGAIGLGSFGAAAHDMPTFKRLFIVEWSHRFVAALVAIVACGALVVTLRHPSVRQRIGVSFGICCGLIVFQAILGGILVKSGTSTHWLFLHLGTAALILGLVVWSILRLIAPTDRPVGEDLSRNRRRLRLMLHGAVGLVWIQIMLGALVAGSRVTGHDGEVPGDFVSEWPLMHKQFMPVLWDGARPVAWNLLDNALLHQWVHRWFAWVAVIGVVAAWWISRSARPGPRLRLAMQVSLTFLGVQALLGVANVVLSTPIIVSLAHLVMAMFLLAALMLAMHDARYETDADPMAVPQGVPA